MARPRLFDRLKARYEAVLQGDYREVTVSMPEPVKRYTPEDVAALRARLKMSQGEFAVLLNVSPKTVESWEQGLRPPSAAAARLLQIVENPEAFSCVVRDREKIAAATSGA
jgi:putative transcriptional regulator